MTAATDVDARLEAARRGDRVALARLLSTLENDPAGARAIASATWTSRRAFSIGVTGAPGVGKSTLVDRLVERLVDRDAASGGTDVGVLCVDPTSPFSGGAILGDRVRMQRHALDHHVFIRSLATRGDLGGLSVAVPDGVALLGAVGFGVVVVETVGVGQVELDVATTADATVVVVTPGWGDALQAAKAGLLEVADVFVVNKADRPGASEAARDLDQMLELGAPRLEGWRPPIVTTTATDGGGVAELVDELVALRAHLAGPAGAARRVEQSRAVLHRLAAAALQDRLGALEAGSAFAAAATSLAEGRTDPYRAVELLDLDAT